MAVYRQIQTSFWLDSEILSLTPEQKYFYIYLLTNGKTKQCGCYEISKSIIQFETGYNVDTVDKLILIFEELGKIKYDIKTKELLLLNWYKYNNLKSDKVKICIKREIGDIKCETFAKYCCDRFEIPYQDGIDNKNKNNNNNKNKEKEEEQYEEDFPSQDSKESLTLSQEPSNLPSDIPLSEKENPPTVKKSKYQQQAEELINYYNNLKEHHPIKPTLHNTADIIRRLKEGNEMEACKAVIFFKKQTLLDDMAMYWTPVSMFRKSNFYRSLESVKLKLQSEDFKNSLDK